jgi:hypothetical protein
VKTEYDMASSSYVVFSYPQLLEHASYQKGDHDMIISLLGLLFLNGNVDRSGILGMSAI